MFRCLSTALMLVPLLALSGCHLMFGPEGGQSDGWTYCDRDGCVKCNIDGCDLPKSQCDPDLPYDTCPSGSYCDPGRRVCRGTTCTKAADCGSGYICHSGVCVPQRVPCGGHGDCGPGAYCSNGTCKPSDTCKKDSDCVRLGDFECSPSGTCVPRTPAPTTCTKAADCSGGFCVNGACGSCTGDCGGGKTCQLGRHCANGRVCLDGQCTNSCTKESQCASGQTCKSGTCIARTTAQCKTDAQCGKGTICVNQVCHPDCTASGTCAKAGDACSATISLEGGPARFCTADHSAKLECKVTSECTGGETCVNGVCRTACQTDKDCKVCDDGPVCGKGGYCMTQKESTATCVRNSQCSGGKACLNGQCVTL